MQDLRHHRRRLSWIAFVAIFALALVPTMSRWLAAGQGGSMWAQICTPQGMKLLAQAGAEVAGQPAQPASPHIDHCALCGLAGQAFAPPPGAPAVTMDEPAAEQPARLRHAPRPLFAWAASQPRAPPIVRA